MPSKYVKVIASLASLLKSYLDSIFSGLDIHSPRRGVIKTVQVLRILRSATN